MSDKIALSYIPSPRHALQGHPESPHRFGSFEALFTDELGQSIDLHESVDQREDTLDAIRLAHTEDYIRRIEGAMSQAPVFLDYGDTYATPNTFDSATAAVAGTLAVVEAIHTGICKYGFALIRPPGHHASKEQASGFCIFNNIAIAAKALQNNGYAKVAIYDFDVHHGNGTQDIFYADPDVLYLSTHQWGIYPGSGAKHELGSPPGEGATINIPLPAYSGDDAFRSCMGEIINPAIYRFKPDFMLISAGFDAHWSDPLANLQLSTSGYASLAEDLIQTAEELCDGRIAFVLEGGYDPEALTDNVSAVLHKLAGLTPPPDRMGPAPIDEPDIRNLVAEIRTIHSL